jgi:hypothetical protein
MSSTYYHNGRSKHRSHADQITAHLKECYPRWVPTTELIEVTSSMNIQARITQVRDVYGHTALECSHRSEEAYYRLSPLAPRLPVTKKNRKRMMVPCEGLSDHDKSVITDFADLILSCKQEGFNEDEMSMVLDGARQAVQQVVDLNAIPDDGLDWYTALTTDFREC